VLVSLVRYGLLLPPLVLMCVPEPTSKRSSPLTVDLFYSVMLFLLVTGLVLGSFVVKQVSQGSYPLALAQSLMVMALVLMILSWLWNPHSGFIGIGHLMSRYLMSLGLPFERWVKGLADLAERDLEACANANENCFCSEGRKEGSTAFIEKRKPLLKEFN
jgi:hypothetical protein